MSIKSANCYFSPAGCGEHEADCFHFTTTCLFETAQRAAVGTWKIPGSITCSLRNASCCPLLSRASNQSNRKMLEKQSPQPHPLRGLRLRLDCYAEAVAPRQHPEQNTDDITLVDDVSPIGCPYGRFDTLLTNMQRSSAQEVVVVRSVNNTICLRRSPVARAAPLIPSTAVFHTFSLLPSLDASKRSNSRQATNRSAKTHGIRWGSNGMAWDLVPQIFAPKNRGMMMSNYVLS
ncbi:hypothetical protein F5Y17DRAFT_423356 [Xylariaceae sp. FL0594]|nr:hypothetical protein F5Y17DRAFT_423356 [Xylariaceae sp. FL0594]